MGLQFIVASDDVDEVQRRLGIEASRFEIFSIPGVGIGVSIPTRLFDQLGEDEIMRLVRPLARFDLYEGAWVQ